MSWRHVPLIQVIKDTGVELTEGGEGEDGPKYVGAHTTKHGSSSGSSLVVWHSNWWCSSCQAKGTVVDWLADAGKIGDTLIESRQDAIDYLVERYGPPPDEWEPPAPFVEMHGPEFPVEALPDAIRGYVREVAESYQVPVDLPASLALAVCAAASAGRLTVHAGGDWREPTNLYVAVAMVSGERKSPVFVECTQPLEDLERTLIEEASPKIAEAAVLREILEAELKALKKDAARAVE